MFSGAGAGAGTGAGAGAASKQDGSETLLKTAVRRYKAIGLYQSRVETTQYTYSLRTGGVAKEVMFPIFYIGNSIYSIVLSR